MAAPVLERHRDQHLAQLNGLRGRNDLSALRSSSELDGVAQTYACLLAATGHFDHVGPDGSTLGRRVAHLTLPLCAFAENLARGQNNVRAALADWVLSEAHRQNLYSPGMSLVGLGVAMRQPSEPDTTRASSLSALAESVAPKRGDGAGSGYVWVQIFARECKHP